MATLIRLKQIESGSALQTSAEVGADFSQSVIDVVAGEVVGILPDGIISGSTQLDGATLRNITIAPIDADGYSLIVSGAVAIVDATNLSGSTDLDEDTTIPAQIWINGISGSTPPPDPSIGGEAQSNEIDLGEW